MNVIISVRKFRKFGGVGRLRQFFGKPFGFGLHFDERSKSKLCLIEDGTP